MESRYENCLTSVEDKKRRHLVSCSSLQNLLQTISALIAGLSNWNGVDISKLQHGYVCRSCVGQLEKYHQLHKVLHEKLSAAMPILPKLSSAELSAMTMPTMPAI